MAASSPACVVFLLVIITHNLPRPSGGAFIQPLRQRRLSFQTALIIDWRLAFHSSDAPPLILLFPVLSTFGFIP
jgi:hypothetical protein